MSEMSGYEIIESALNNFVGEQFLEFSYDFIKDVMGLDQFLILCKTYKVNFIYYSGLNTFLIKKDFL